LLNLTDATGAKSRRKAAGRFELGHARAFAAPLDRAGADKRPRAARSAGPACCFSAHFPRRRAGRAPPPESRAALAGEWIEAYR